MSDFNLTKLSTKDLEAHLNCSIEAENNVIIIGKRGSGKTQISKDTIKTLGYKELYLNLSVLEKPDLAGYPNFFSKNERKYVEYLMPAFLQPLIEGEDKCVALLDEVDKAEPSLWAPLLELTQFHTINGVALPNLKSIVMTGNLQSEGGNRPSLPLLDRAEAYLLEPTHKHWLDWAGRSGEIHPSISAYIADHPDDLHGNDDDGDSYKASSPRGWHNASKVVKFGEKHGWNNTILTEKVSGYVGKKIGFKYSAYFQHYQVLLPLIKKIMDGEKIKSEFEKLEPSKQMVACMIMCARLSNQLDALKAGDPKPDSIKFVSKFLKDCVDPEMTLVCVRSMIGIKRTIANKLDEEPDFAAIFKELTKRING
jgi:hypothetical protein